MVIRLSSHDGHGAIELLDEDEAHHLVGEGHLGEGNLLDGLGIDFGREAVGTAYDEDEALADGVHLLLHVLGELYAAQLFSVLVEQHDVVTWLELLEYQLSFLLLLLLGGERFRGLQFGNHRDVKAYVVFHALGVVVYQFDEMFVDGLSDQ